MRRILLAAFAGVALFIPVSPALAGTLTTQNSCYVSANTSWHHMNVELAGAGSPSPVASGSGLSLTTTSARATIPQYMVDYAGNADLLKDGANEIPATVWLAIAAPGTPQGVQVVSADVVARTTVTTSGGLYQSATPLDVTVPLPDTAWTAAASPVGFKQGPARSLPRIPAGPAGAMITPKGSAFIKATMGGLVITFDCQPGTGEGQQITAPTPIDPQAFETVAINAGATPLPAPKPTTAVPALTLRTTKLRVSGKRVSLALACADAPCKGTVSLKYAGGLVTQSAKYSLAAGGRKTLKLTLSAKARKALKKKSLLVAIKITTEGGKTVSKKLRLK